MRHKPALHSLIFTEKGTRKEKGRNHSLRSPRHLHPAGKSSYLLHSFRYSSYCGFLNRGRGHARMMPLGNTTHGWSCWEAESITDLIWPHIFPLHHYHLHLITASWSCLACCGHSAGLGPWPSTCDICWAQPFLSQQDNSKVTWSWAKHTK